MSASTRTILKRKIDAAVAAKSCDNEPETDTDDLRVALLELFAAYFDVKTAIENIRIRRAPIDQFLQGAWQSGGYYRLVDANGNEIFLASDNSLVLTVATKELTGQADDLPGAEGGLSMIDLQLASPFLVDLAQEISGAQNEQANASDYEVEERRNDFSEFMFNPKIRSYDIVEVDGVSLDGATSFSFRLATPASENHIQLIDDGREAQGPIQAPPYWRPRVLEIACAVPIQCSASLGALHLTMKDLMELEEGQEFVLPEATIDQVSLSVCREKMAPLTSGAIGAFRGHRALRVTAPLHATG